MNSKKISYGGIGTALGLVILFLTRVIPINTLTLLTLASCIIPIIIIKTDVRTGVYVYIATTLIGFFLVPSIYIALYALLFGIYGIIKYFIEKTNRLFQEIVLKYIFFNIILALIYLILGNLTGLINIKLPLFIVIILCEIAFLIYDYALTLIISFFIKKNFL